MRKRSYGGDRTATSTLSSFPLGFKSSERLQKQFTGRLYGVKLQLSSMKATEYVELKRNSAKPERMQSFKLQNYPDLFTTTQSKELKSHQKKYTQNKP